MFLQQSFKWNPWPLALDRYNDSPALRGQSLQLISIKTCNTLARLNHQALSMGRGRTRTTAQVRGDEGQQPPPFHTMDPLTKGRLEEIRRRVPRYLFRAWTNTHPRVSGGFASLNSTEGIVPLAFRAGRGHSSVYDMTRSEMLDMVLKHLDYRRDFYTEFSSSTASLAYAMLFFGSDITDVHISIVDTEDLRLTNEVFFILELTLLADPTVEKKQLEDTLDELNKMHHEYLIHGPVRSIAHSAVLLDQFTSAGFDLQTLALPGVKIKKLKPVPVTPDEVARAKQVADRYSDHLALPIALALISLQQRSLDLFLRDDSADLQQVLAGVGELHLLPTWSRDNTIMEDRVFSEYYTDIRQFIHLMRAIVRRDARSQAGPVTVASGKSKFLGGETAEEPQEHQRTPPSVNAPKRKWFVRFSKGIANLVRRPSQAVMQRRNTRSAARVIKTPTSRGLLKIETAALARAMKKLEIDMNRHGKEEHGGKNERDSEANMA